MSYLNLRTMEKTEGRNPSVSEPAINGAKDDAMNTSTIEYTTSQEHEFSLPENVILQTKNYSMFKLDSLNRVIRQDKVDRLYDAVQEKNLLHLFPIIVNRQFVVMDGQHRLKVAEALDTPIYYIVSSQMRIEDAARANQNVTTWRSIDYLEHWCKLGLPDYIRFKEFMAANQFLTFTEVRKLLAHGGQSAAKDETEGLARIFNDGRFHINDISHATAVAGMARDFSEWVRFWKESTFVNSLSILATNPDYDHGRMLAKMEYLSTRLVKCADTRSYIAVLEELYNHKVMAANRVHFDPLPQRRYKAKTE